MSRSPSQPSIMGASRFSVAPGPRVQRSVFNRSHGYKTTFNEGDLIPFYIDEILPGDSLSLTATFLARLQTLEKPAMDNIFLDSFFFFVPCRLLWENWEKFQGAQDDPGEVITDFVVPVLGGSPLVLGEGDLSDYFGLPVNIEPVAGDEPIALPFRAYNFIWNEWFRDQNLQNSAPFLTDDGPDDYIDNYIIRKRGKRHDYFTSCLPWPQKGDAISLPLGTSAPVLGDGMAIGLDTIGSGGGRYLGLRLGASDGPALQARDTIGAAGAALTGSAISGDKYVGLSQVVGDSHIFADLSAATAATINQLREAFAFQQILETDARGGTRYVEQLRSRWNVVSPDFRLQRPEYLGGASTRFGISQVEQTAEGVEAVANLAGYGTVVSRSGFHKSFVEHGYVIGLVNVRADITYQQQMRRMWNRSTRFEFYMPELAHLGEQAVLNREIWYASAGAMGTQDVFGYQERWAEYRYHPSIVTGRFRSQSAAPLDVWHLALDFVAQPLLNASFIQDAPPISRLIATPVLGEPHFLMDSYIKIKHARPMPVYSIPGLTRL